MNDKEQYPEDWIHGTLHFNPESGDCHYDGKAREIVEKLKENSETHKELIEECLKLIAVLKDYNKLLGEDLDSHASISNVHGFNSPTIIVEKGEKLRSLINKAEKRVEVMLEDYKNGKKSG